MVNPAKHVHAAAQPFGAGERLQRRPFRTLARDHQVGPLDVAHRPDQHVERLVAVQAAQRQQHRHAGGHTVRAARRGAGQLGGEVRQEALDDELARLRLGVDGVREVNLGRAAHGDARVELVRPETGASPREGWRGFRAFAGHRTRATA